MRNAVIVLSLLLGAGSAGASTSTVDGVVTRVDSRWTAAGDAIVSEVTIRRDDGTEIVVLERGGTVDGIGMWQSHSPPVPAVGARVSATVSAARTLAGDTVQRVETLAPVVPPGDRVEANAFYVNTRTRKSGIPLRWESGCVFISYDETGTSHLDNEAEIMNGVLQTWQTVTADCNYLELRVDEAVEANGGYDGMNLIVFMDDRWCRPATDEEPEMCYSGAAAALTTLFFVDDPGNSRDGAIVDADIELNGVNFAISHEGASNGSAGCMADLANTLTHEVGHLLGLDHTCWDGTGTQPVDDQGAPVPSCSPESALSSEIKDATMYNFQTCGETKKSSPEQDDIDAICDLYPLASGPGKCKRVDIDGGGGCCTIAPGARRTAASDAAGGLALAMLAATILAASRRRRR